MRQPDSTFGGALHSEFPATHWSIVLNAGDVGGAHATQAIENLCESYWRPLYVFARRSGQAHADAQDLTQRYFAYSFKPELLKAAKAEKGRFRSFLLGSFKRFYCRERDRANAQKRGGKAILISTDEMVSEEADVAQAVDSKTPEAAFEYQWAITVLKLALRHVQDRYKAVGKETTFSELKVFLQANAKMMTYAEAAKRLAKSEASVSKAIGRLRKRFDEAVREELSRTVDRQEDIEDELQYLRRILNR